MPPGKSFLSAVQGFGGHPFQDRGETQEETRENNLSVPPALNRQCSGLGTRCQGLNNDEYEGQEGGPGPEQGCYGNAQRRNPWR